MQFITVLLAAASVAFAKTVPTVSSYGSPGRRPGCFGTPLATWSGVPEDAFCQATPGAIALNVTTGTSTRCKISLYTTSNCDGTTGGFISTVPLADLCSTASQEIGSVRILCITTG
ncbi:hypothetical protein B0H17DRAFT_1069096 [Mycena rosella]|uniref:Uncharacterized protein n=1 Tax=Mycena rosella TaxID=1033263 RepID=A0AAD7DC48_MYCRO|nr:hypothetical protein B0H17DRAFT_1069096 [Mycena rosella]